MSLIRQVWMLLLGVIFAATLGGVAASVWTARSYLSTQLTIKNNDNAQALALALSQSGGDPTLIEVAVSAQFDTGYYQAVKFRSPEGRLLVDKTAAGRLTQAPGWFVRMNPIDAQAGVAAVTSGWKQLGTVELASQDAFAYDSLWAGAVRMAVWIGFVGLCAACVAWWGVQRISKQLDEVVAQAGALIERRFVTIEEPHTPELLRVAHAMNVMVDRIRAMFAEQSDQLDALRRQASCDLTTGVPHRAHFMAVLSEALHREDAYARGGLFLIRLAQLGEVNRSLGRIRTDELLKVLSTALGKEQIGSGATIGRLNGSDFALLLPSIPSVSATGQAVLGRLQSALESFTPATLIGAGIEWQRGDTIGELLGAVDLALARAEASGPFTFESALHSKVVDTPVGEEAWRHGILSAIDQGRVKLVTFPVLDPHGALLHYECPLRIQLLPEGSFEPAARWLPYALRTGQVARSDETAVALALQAIARDGLPRGVNVSPLSLNDAGFVPRLREQIAAQRSLTRQLWIEVDEAAVDSQPAALEELCRQLRPLGVKVGLEHAGHRIAHLGKVLDAGLDYVKLAAAVISHVDQDPTRAAHVKGIASILHGMGVAVYAEGVSNPDELATLWRCKIDGVTGPAVHMSS